LIGLTITSGFKWCQFCWEFGRI